MLRVWLIAIFSLTVLCDNALGQSAAGTIGGLALVQNDLARHHLGPTGSACLTIDGYAKPERVNKDIYQHWIKATNSCGQLIKVRICYRNSDHCIDMDVPPWDKKESMLGIFPALKRFQFEAKEQF
jgi:hypothetical protein